MYVAPRPQFRDDPNFPIRIAACSAIMLAIADGVTALVPVVVVSFPVAFALSLRGAFNLRKTIAFGVALPVVTWLLGLFFAILREVPLLMVLGAFTVILLGIHIARQTGNVLGFLIAMISVLLSIMAMQSRAMLDIARDDIITGCVSVAVVMTLLYALMPARTNVIQDNVVLMARRSLLAGSILRALVVTGYCFWLYSVLPASDMLLAMMALFPLVYPGRGSMIAEARERVLGTVLGIAATVAVLAIFLEVPYFSTLMVLFALSGLGFGWGMIKGRMPVLVYQFAHLVLLGTAVTALTSQAATQALFSRYGLTLVGTAGAVVIVLLVEESFPRLFRNEADLRAADNLPMGNH